MNGKCPADGELSPGLPVPELFGAAIPIAPARSDIRSPGVPPSQRKLQAVAEGEPASTGKFRSQESCYKLQFISLWHSSCSYTIGLLYDRSTRPYKSPYIARVGTHSRAPPERWNWLE
jgi:hypothetical protein